MTGTRQTGTTERDAARADGSSRTVPLPDDGLCRRHLFGLDLVDERDLGPVEAAVLGWPSTGEQRTGAAGPAGRLPVLVTPNVDIMVHLDRNPDSVEADVFRRARYVLPDGMPVVAASRLLRRPLASRLTGSGLFERLWPRLVAEDRAVVVLCASEEIAGRLERDGGRAAYVVPPYIDPADHGQVDDVVGEIIDQATAGGAALVLLGLGNPKDAVIAARLVERWPEDGGPTPLCLGLGGSFEMYAGLKRRAPRWVQRIGMEWFHRFLQEPRRLFHRYFVRDTAFIGIVIRQGLALRREGRS